MNFVDELRKKTKESTHVLEENHKRVAKIKCEECKEKALDAAKRGKYKVKIWLYIFEENAKAAGEIADMCIDELKSCGLSAKRKSVRSSGEIIGNYKEYSVPISVSWH